VTTGDPAAGGPAKARAPLTPEQVQRAKTMGEIDQARVDAYDEAISQVTDALGQLERVRDQVEASAKARAKLVADWPMADADVPAVYVPARYGEGSSLWQHYCGQVVPDSHDCGRCDEEAPALPGEWRQLYVRGPGSADA
jgi:hypothetical protein